MINLNDFQSVIFNILNKNSFDVYDYVPENSDLPLVVTEGTFVSKLGAKLPFIYNVTQNIDCYSEYNGKKEINSIANDVIKCLEDSIGFANENFCICDINFGSVGITKELGETSIIYKASIVANFTIEEK